ncbi:MAG TPA: HAD family hydrolase [Thermoanaerobaculia bacterium]
MNRYAALLFDFGGTLDAEGVPWKARFARLFLDLAPETAQVFDRAFYDADDALVGSIPKNLGLEGTAYRLAADVARALGRPELAEIVARRFLKEAQSALSRSESLLARLSPRYRLGIVSNFYGNLDAVCRETGLARHLTAALDSAVVGAEKPDPRIFRTALDAVGAQAEQTIFIGDSLARDMAGARAVGIPHVWLSAEGSQACCSSDRIIRRLGELEEVLA